MTLQGRSRALILAAHGSRRGSQANAIVRRIAETIRRRRLYDEVAVAFHQGEPGFDTVLDEIESDQVTVVPFFTSAGHYTEVVLPQALTQNRRYEGLRLRQTPPLGTHGELAPLVARRVTGIMREHGLERSSVSLALVGHGTRRHPDSRESTLQLADTLRRRRVAGEVLAMFIDDEPSVETLLDTAALPHVMVVPFLIGGGSHVVDDIPRLIGRRQRPCRVIIDEAVGTYAGMADLIIDLARRHPPPAPSRFGPRPVSTASGTSASRPESGTVDLVGAGPGDPGLITTRGLELLRRADVIVHDRLIGSELLGEARTDATLIDVGKGPDHAPYSQEEINRLLVQHAQRGQHVVRLKGGDPFVFGRGSEEVAACEVARVRVRVVPGVTSAVAGPGACGIPLTARGVAQSFTVLAGRSANGDGPSLAGSGQTLPVLSIGPEHTLVILMGRANLAGLAAQLIAQGRDPATPAACIQSATTPEQRVTRATLATIAEAVERDGLESPVVTVVGAVAAMGEALVPLPYGCTTITRTSPGTSFTPLISRPSYWGQAVPLPSSS